MIKWDDIINNYMGWLDSHTSFSGFLIRQCSIIPGVFGIGTIKVLKWIDGRVRLLIRKPLPNYLDNEYMVEDYRGMVITQEEHTRAWGFPGYPTGHDTNCDCTHCTTATHHYRINTGYSMVRGDYTPTRENVYDYLDTLSGETFGYNSEGIIFSNINSYGDDFLPKKKIKSHKLVERKYTLRGPGVYTREVDYSTIDLNGNCFLEQ